MKPTVNTQIVSTVFLKIIEQKDRNNNINKLKTETHETSFKTGIHDYK